jgi:ParB family chromosome partitioning protein
MSNSKSRLGRGLSGLISGTERADANPSSDAITASTVKKVPSDKDLGDGVVSSTATTTTTTTTNALGYTELELKSIVPNPYQPRREIQPELIEELAKSIQSEGLLQPIVVRNCKGGGYELIAGERRLTAYKHLKLNKIPARIINASDASSASLALIENLQRENLNPIDEALGYASLLQDFDLTQEAVAERVAQSRTTVANSLRLLSLDSEIQGFLSRRLISTGHAKVILGLKSTEHRKILARRIIETGMSVRESEVQVRNLKVGKVTGKVDKSKVSEAEQAAVRDLEKRIGEYFNTRVGVQHSSKKGRITIEYFGNDDLDRILEKLGIG